MKSHLINATLLAALLTVAAIAYPDLPARIPGHFDLGGTVSRWDQTTPWAWFGLPLVAAGIGLLLFGLGRFISARPNFVKLPDGRRADELGTESRQQVMSLVDGALGWCGALATIVFSLIEFATWRIAFGMGGGGIVTFAVVSSIVVLPIPAIVMLVRMGSRR